MSRKHKYLKDEQAKAFYEITEALESANYETELTGAAAVLGNYNGKENIETRLIRISGQQTPDWPARIGLENSLKKLKDKYVVVDLKKESTKHHRLHDRGEENSKLYLIRKKNIVPNEQLDLFYQNLPVDFLIYEPADKKD